LSIVHTFYTVKWEKYASITQRHTFLKIDHILIKYFCHRIHSSTVLSFNFAVVNIIW
jgi:hypothetical protein